MFIQSQNVLLNVYGFDSNDRGVGIVRAHDENDILIAGLTSRNTANEQDIYIVRTDALGRLIWERTYRMPGFENAWSLKKTMDGNYVVTGFSKDSMNDHWNIFLLKIDEDGNKIWLKKYLENLDQYAWGLNVTVQNDILIIGQTEVDSNQASTLIKKVSRSGSILWRSTLEGIPHNRAYSIIEIKDHLFFTGLINTKNKGTDGFLGKMDGDGNLEWIRRYGGKNDDVLHTIKRDRDNNLVLFGYSKSYGTNNSPWLVKVNLKGEEIWNHSYGSQNEERIVAGAITEANNYIMTGYVLKKEPNAQDNNFDVLSLKIDKNGNLIWLKTFGGNKNEETGQSIVVDKDNFFITGRTYSTNNKKGDLFLARISSTNSSF